MKKKFRVKNTGYGKPSISRTIGEWMVSFAEYEWELRENMSEEALGYEFQMFTGLKDRNGAEIWEGDIITYLGHTYKIGLTGGGFFLENEKNEAGNIPMGIVNSKEIVIENT